MANEGEFPKAAGDVAYASEANRFARAGGFIDNGSTSWSTGSSTALQILGSSVFNAGSYLGNNFGVLKIKAYGAPIINTYTGQMRIRISGISLNADINTPVISTSGAVNGFNGALYNNSQWFFVSGLNSNLFGGASVESTQGITRHLTTYVQDSLSTSIMLLGSGLDVTNNNDVVVFYEIRSNSPGSQIIIYSLNSIRGTI